MPKYPTGRLFQQMSADRNWLDEFRKADVIIGYRGDIPGLRGDAVVIVFYGASLIEAAGRETKSETKWKFEVDIDTRTNDIEVMIESCLAAKGHCDCTASESTTIENGELVTGSWTR